MSRQGDLHERGLTPSPHLVGSLDSNPAQARRRPAPCHPTLADPAMLLPGGPARDGPSRQHYPMRHDAVPPRLPKQPRR